MYSKLLSAVIGVSCAAYANAAAHVRTGPTGFAITFDENAEAGKAGSFNVLGDVAAKHEPFLVQTSDSDYTVSVRGGEGSTTMLHPQDFDAHYITHAWVEDENGDVVCSHTFTAEDAAASFVCNVKDSAGTTLTPYEHCNLHGVWQGPTYDRAKEAAVYPGAFADMNVQVFLKVTDAAPLKHEPAFSVDDDSFQIAVLGNDGAGLHPHAPPDHYITKVWTKDAHGVVVTVTELGDAVTEAMSPAFSVPDGFVGTLTPYEHCNLHGIWEGASIEVAAAADDEAHDEEHDHGEGDAATPVVADNGEGDDHEPTAEQKLATGCTFKNCQYQMAECKEDTACTATLSAEAFGITPPPAGSTLAACFKTAAYMTCIGDADASSAGYVLPASMLFATGAALLALW